MATSHRITVCSISFSHPPSCTERPSPQLPPGNEMDSSSHTDHLLPGNLLKLPSNVQLIVGGLIALHVVFIVVALSCHFRSSRSAKPDFKSKLG